MINTSNIAQVKVLMINNTNIGNGGENIIPSARKSIHAHRGICPFILNENMGRYGRYSNSRQVQKNSHSQEEEQGTDVVDNVMSKMARPSYPSPIQREICRRNSVDLPQNDQISSDDENMLSKSSPAILSPLYYSDDLYTSATQNENNASRNGLQNEHNTSSNGLQNEVNISRNERLENKENTRYRFQNEQNTSKNRLQIPSNNDRNGKNTSVSKSKTNLGLIFKPAVVVILVIASVVIGINTDYFTNNKIANELIFYDDIKNVCIKYKVGSDSILRLRTGISTISKNRDTASFMFVYDSNAENYNPITFNNFIDELASKTVKYLRDGTASHVVVDTKRIETDLELMNLHKDVDRTGVMLVPNIHDVPSKLAMAFHYYCDEYNPLVKRSAIFFTLDSATCFINKKLTHQYIEKCLSKKWSNIQEEILGPLLTRVVNIVIDATDVA